jgi:HEAT repeat protein
MIRIRTIVSLAGVGLAALLMQWGAGAPASGQEARPSGNSRETQLIAVLKETDAPLKAKADACLELSRVGSKDSVAPLAALLGDEKLAHMARYALEPIPDPAVDAALRDAMGRLKGRPLVGVIGSLGVRRDAKAVEPLSRLLSDPNPEVAQAAARALGNISNPAAVEALKGALDGASADNQRAICEGLLRCAEALRARGLRDVALTIYDRLNQPRMPQPIRDGAARKARVLRQEAGPRL